MCCLFYHDYFIREKEYIYFLNQKEQNFKKAN